MSTAQALEVVRQRVAPELDADAFVLKLIADEAYRRSVTTRIGSDAAPFEHPFEPID